MFNNEKDNFLFDNYPDWQDATLADIIEDNAPCGQNLIEELLDNLVGD